MGTLNGARQRGDQAFAVVGAGCLVVAVFAVGLILLDRMRRLSGLVPLTVAVGTALAGLLLLFAHRRAPTWMASAASDRGVSAPVAHASDRWIVATLALIALVPRWIALRHSLIVDELWTLSFVQRGPLYAVTHQSEYNNHLLNSLLCSLLLEARSALLGVPAASDTSWYPLMRAPSLLFGVASAPLLYLAVRTRLPRDVSLVAALLLALSPVAVDVSAQSRGYAAMICLTIAAALALESAARTARPLTWLSWLLCTTLAALAHLYSGFAVVAGGLCFGLAGLTASEPTRRRCLLEQALLLPAVWACLTIAGFAGVLGVMRAALHTEASRPLDARMDQVLLPMLQRWGGSMHGAAVPIYYLLVLVLLTAGLVSLRRQAPIVALYCGLLLFLPPIVVEILRPHFVFMRFFVVALPAFLLCIACGLREVARLLCRPVGDVHPSRLFGGLSAVLLAGSAIRLMPVLLLPKQDYKQSAAFLKRKQREGAAVAVIGVGYQYFNRYGMGAYYPATGADLDRYVRAHHGALLVDTGIRVHPLPADLRAYLRRHQGRPVAIFPARYGDWPYRSKDEESDFTVSPLSAEPLPSNSRDSSSQ